MKKMMLLVLSAAVVLSAAFVPVDRAKTVAENQYKQYCADAATKNANIVRIVEHEFEGEVTWYAVEFEKGFVIVSADDSVRPILGYSDHGTVPTEKVWQYGGQNFKEWFGKYDREIAYMRANKIVDEYGAQTWKNIEANVFPSTKAGVVVDRLVQSKWDQVWPWWNDCPEKIDTATGLYDNTYVGCVATAMAQILRYHQWPDVGTGSASYSWNDGNSNLTLSADFTTHTWDYSLMPVDADYEDWGLYPEYWEGGITEAEVTELALQSYWCGLSVNMDYGTYTDGGSGAYMSNVDNAFIDHWKGASTYATFSTPAAPPTADGSYATIKAQLDAGRPWQWAGGVHSFVLDGYRDDYWYHFNWGWLGSYDGWFHRSSLIPGGSGSGGGDGDYTSGQIGITYTPSTNPFTAWPTTTVSGSLSNGEDATINWTAQTGATEYKLYRTKDMAGTPTLITTTTGLSYVQNDLPVGDYAYSVIVVYPTGESHMSSAFTVSVVFDNNYPNPTGLKATANGRTSIDLTWVEPFVGIMNTYEDFEHDGEWPTGWVGDTSDDNNTGSVWDGDANGYVIFANGYPTWYYGSRIDGWFTGRSSGADRTVWILSPQYTLNSSHYMKWWVRFRWSADGDEGGPLASGMNYPQYQVVSYAGTFSETKRESNISYTTHKSYVGGTDPENIWAFEETANINYTGTARVGFRCPVISSTYSLGFDKITIGSPVGGGDDPDGFEIYRGGSLVTTLTDGTATGWSDTGFADGINSYYVKATYPTGTSFASLTAYADMDANPKPDYLSGTVSPATSANLSWYMPYHNAPKWYTYFDPHYATSTTTLGDGGIYAKRTRFVSTDLGYYYPITVDSIAAVFYDDNEADWGGEDQFKFQVVYGYQTLADTNITVLHTSADLTAVHNTMVKYKLPTPLVITQDFNIEVLNTSGNDNPTNLMKLVDQSHSFNKGEDGTYFWSIVYGDKHYEWSILAYITSSEPDPIAKGAEAYVEPETKTRELVNPRSIPVAYTGKALDYYKIYRDGSAIGTSTTVNYIDSSVPATADYTYKVSAYYADPAGESDFSNEITLNVEAGSSLTAPANVVSSISGSNIIITWDAVAGATSYNVYSSADPYGTFTLTDNAATNSYTVATGTKLFYYFTSTDSKAIAPKTIEIAKPVTK